MTDIDKLKYLEVELNKVQRELYNTNIKMEAMRKKFRSDIIRLEGHIKRTR